ncbi:DNA-directed RNA polymerase subunit beta [Lactobacillus delbrueckii subsp. delbrueckii DSM 20074 = JCM 1012]|uniref:DNA-directed RNA polymerase subunit beta' n=1 Tax=Lactobacillus delbrueckii TaxID=1584 RepID=UPI000699BCF8|nr:DNA-directed RNA polymerase subunit beta' [Lactobacillus delbrueckii]APP10701.1 DNA-directed RNA polymerase subunit beta' [Lactobacillus delbrueckii subsp. delbrueckii DSM 20074 = JCM 1012]KNZ38596.1 DNA-directed RNA polymerase subunit beta' [Lactobacillus delbrueckii subsp. delbrueckii]KRK27162.1 DNA-directed RNA polymerase subunit beta [Lactobacillus delbrueckii subsp. delbrueckii DSM 20074 = JCM 1012]MCT3494137.1 DNA-directed RNA polymerase subunit beta' [Lactobacillus delbrueckii]MCT352
MIDVNKFESMQIGLASPNKIRSWSYGEVKKPETINYRTLKPEKDGLFDERIFGPTKDYACACGKYKGVRYKGIVCDRCGVEVTTSHVRRERMGHIELAAPVTHIWYFKGIPSRMGLVLDVSPKQLEEVIYFAAYIVIDPGDTGLEAKQLLTEAEYREEKAKYGNRFVAKMGAEAIRDLLKQVDLDKEVTALKAELQTLKGQKRTRAIRRLDILDAFRNSGNKPEWMVMETVPVIPPDLRPMVQLEGGRFATSDLNDLYRRVINRNNRLKKLLDMHAPSLIVQNEERMLQEAVDALIDNGRRGRPVVGPGNRPLKSISHMLKGKQGRFRQNLLGKRVDYSGRSVIDVSPKLKLYQCGVPRPMALELFKPFVMRELVRRGIASNIKNAKRKIDREDDDIWDVLEYVIKERPVLLNRAPTLHRLSIQAFEPVLVPGKALRLHPLACEAYNADFDGDQMAIHVPLSDEAVAESRLLMLAAHHILTPKDGTPIVTPSQDIVLGNYWLTQAEIGREGEGMIFATPEEATIAYNNGDIHYHTIIGVSAASMPKKDWGAGHEDSIFVTTYGRLVFNSLFPDDYFYINEPTQDNLKQPMADKYFLEDGQDIRDKIAEIGQDLVATPFKKGFLGDTISEIYKRYRVQRTSEYLDDLKEMGYSASTISGLTIGMADVPETKTKDALVAEARKKVKQVSKMFRRGKLSDKERHDNVIKIWTDCKDAVQKEIAEFKDQKNPISVMQQSGARGNISNFTQLAGMRGLMATPSGELFEIPVISNFKEGLTVLELFMSTHGARKGMTDTALKTAQSGYLTRRLVDVAQDVIIREDDCGTDRGITAKAIVDKDAGLIESLYDRLVGRFTNRTIRDPQTGEVICPKGVLMDEQMAQKIVDAGVQEVQIRSILTCNTSHGICRKCYGRNLATGEEVEIGEAVGTVAAQSIGEPGTQLTLRTFHTGGVAGAEDITQGLPRVQELFEARNPKGRAVISEVDGVVDKIESNAAEHLQEITVKGKIDTRVYTIPYTAKPAVQEGDEVHRGDKLIPGSIDPKELIKVTDTLTTEEYILAEVQKSYRTQGVDLADKHAEVLTRQMLQKVRVLDPGETDILPGEVMDIAEFRDRNRDVIISGGIPATAQADILGITKAALETNSFLSAASFQETTRVLTDASIRGKNDPLLGLKENVIIGKIIPAGTGMPIYRDQVPKADVQQPDSVYSIADLEKKMEDENKETESK